MLVTITLHIRIPKRSTAPMVATAIARLSGESPHDEPRFVTSLDPRPGSTADDSVCRIRPLQRTPNHAHRYLRTAENRVHHKAQDLLSRSSRQASLARENRGDLDGAYDADG